LAHALRARRPADELTLVALFHATRGVQPGIDAVAELLRSPRQTPQCLVGFRREGGTRGA
jgi:hypothetical protein